MNMHEFCDAHDLFYNTFKKWCYKKTLEDFRTSEKKTVNKKLNPTGPRFPEIEETVKQLFDQKRDAGLRVKTDTIKNDALVIAERDQISNFKASNAWALSFKKRNKICWKMV